jgi:hypothetical protein
VRTECLDWTSIWSRGHLERILTNYIRHYNTARPHRSIGLDVPIAPANTGAARIERLGTSTGSTRSVGLSTSTATPPDRYPSAHALKASKTSPERQLHRGPPDGAAADVEQQLSALV